MQHGDELGTRDDPRQPARVVDDGEVPQPRSAMSPTSSDTGVSTPTVVTGLLITSATGRSAATSRLNRSCTVTMPTTRASSVTTGSALTACWFISIRAR